MQKLSLVEKKKLQWAREKEELNRLTGLWPSSGFQKIHFNDVLNSPNCCCQNSCSKNYEEVPDSNKNLSASQISFENSEETTNQKADCDTSGYGSETDIKDSAEKNTNKCWKSQNSLNSDSGFGYSFDDTCGRMKWSNRSVGIHSLDPVQNHHMTNNDAPQWLQRSLNSSNKSYLRGQNVPIEISVLAEREQKRIKAVEVQDVIKQQLEEKEQKRRLEEERRIEEDRKLEERIRLQQEIDRLRFEDEMIKLREKEEIEMKKQLAMKEAIANAEQKAKEVKSTLRNKNKYIKSDENDENQYNLENNCINDCKNNLQTLNLNESKNSKQDETEELKNSTTSDTVDADTQTDTEYSSSLEFIKNKFFDKSTQTIVQNNESHKCRSHTNSIEERPKWGANKSEIRYIKQSEKDPFYQRKLRYRLSRGKKGFLNSTSFEDRSTSTTGDESNVSTSPTNKLYKLTNKYSRSNITNTEKFKKSNSHELKDSTLPDIICNLSNLKQNLKQTFDCWDVECSKIISNIEWK